MGNSRGSTNFFPRIEAWRGMAALMVVWFHAWQSPWRDEAGHLLSLASAMPPLLKFTTNGPGAVSAFFVMSGFVLALSLDRGPIDLRMSAGRFFLSRLFRLYPAIFATITIFAFAYWTTGASLGGDYSVVGIVRNMLLIETTIDGVMWSLQVELIATAVIFLSYALHCRWGRGSVVLLGALLALASFAGHQMRWFGPDLTMLCAFIFGMVTFYCTDLIRRLSPSRSLAGFIVAFVMMCASRPVLGFASHWAALIEAVFAAVVVGFLAYGSLGLAAWLFENRFMNFYGRISYSFYLLHPLTLLVVWSIPDQLGFIVQSGVPPIFLATALALTSIVAITPLAWLSYSFVERTGIASGAFVIRRLMLQWQRQPRFKTLGN